MVGKIISLLLLSPSLFLSTCIALLYLYSSLSPCLRLSLSASFFFSFLFSMHRFLYSSILLRVFFLSRNCNSIPSHSLSIPLPFSLHSSTFLYTFLSIYFLPFFVPFTLRRWSDKGIGKNRIKSIERKNKKERKTKLETREKKNGRNGDNYNL